MTQMSGSQSFRDLIAYRLQRSDDTLHEADCLGANHMYSGAMNRLYYACYYAVSALLINENIHSSTHVGVKSMFGLKFIKPGVIGLEHGKFFNELFEIRHSNDYDDFIFCDEETFKIFRPKADALISQIKSILRSRGLS